MPNLTTVKKSTKKGEKRRSQIRDMAAQIFAEKGYHGSSMQEIAAKLEINKATLYHYYLSKEDVLFDILTYADNEVLKVIDRIQEQEFAQFERARELVTAHVEWYLKHPNVAKVAIRDWTELNGELLEIQTKRRRHYASFLRNAFEEYRADGLIPAETNTTLMLNFINGAITTANIWYNPQGQCGAKHIAVVFGAMAETLLNELHGRVLSGKPIPDFYNRHFSD